MSEKVVVAINEPTLLKQVEEVIREEYEIIIANSGTQVLEKVALDQPWLVILQALLPDMNFGQIVKRLGGTDSTVRPKVLALIPPPWGGGPDMHIEPNTFADMHLPQSFNPKELHAFVHRLAAMK